MKATLLAALATAASVPGAVKAHEFWLAPEQFWSQPAQSLSMSLLVGHGRDCARAKIPVRRIARFEVIGPGNEVLDLRSKLQPGVDTELQFGAAGTYVIVLATDNQARSDLPAQPFNDYLRAEGLTPALAAREQAGLMQGEGSERYSRHAKSIVRVGVSQLQSHVTHAVGLRLEIVPEVDPYLEPRPAQLPVRVLFEGKALAGALVKMSDSAANSATIARVTADDGRAVFDMPSKGSWLLHVTWTEALPSIDEADFDTMFASLTFGLAE